MVKGNYAINNPIDTDGKEGILLSPTAEQLIEQTNTVSIYRNAVNLVGKEGCQYLPTSPEIWSKTIMEIYETMYHKVTDMAEILAILSFRSAVSASNYNEDERPRADTRSAIHGLMSLGYTLQDKLYWDKKSAELVDRAHSKAVFESCYESWLHEQAMGGDEPDNLTHGYSKNTVPEDDTHGDDSDAPGDDFQIVPETFLRRELPSEFYEYVRRTIWNTILHDGASKEKKENDGSSPFEDWL